MSYVSFASRENRLGIVVGKTPARPGSVTRAWTADDRVFDVANRRMTVTAGWQSFNSDHSGWRVDPHHEGNRSWLEVTRGERSKTTIALNDGDILETWAGCPTSKVIDEPLLALAINNRPSGESQFWLFNPETGARLRQFSGHVGRITSLAFAKDGRFLASVSLDHTFRIWGLSDLKESLQVMVA